MAKEWWAMAGKAAANARHPARANLPIFEAILFS
jgi:hypothetical protein